LNIQVYAPREHINQRRTLFALDRVIAWRKMLPLIKGAVWGQDMILQSEDLRDEVPAYCITFVEARYLQFGVFSAVVENHVADKVRMRRYVVKFALRRGILVYAKRVWDAERQIQARLAGSTTNGKGSIYAPPSTPPLSQPPSPPSMAPPSSLPPLGRGLTGDSANGTSEALGEPASPQSGKRYASSSLPGQPET
jgi:hypothetical protein